MVVLSSPRISSHLFLFVLFTGFARQFHPCLLFQLCIFFLNSLITYYEVGTQSLSPYCYILIPTAGAFFNSHQLKLGPFAEHIM